MKQPQNGGRGRPDFLLLVMTLLLVGFGLVMVYSASSSIALVEENDALHYTKRQLMWAGLGVFAMLFSMNIRYQVYKKLFLLYFLPVMALLILVPFIAPDINGAKSWINIAGFTIQPTEPAKLAVILY
ncbi:FtsW/RodA/SpoVE family cell cycle protein, partial [Paenibacillus sp. MCAF20]